jgi:hypothetical protein
MESLLGSPTLIKVLLFGGAVGLVRALVSSGGLRIPGCLTTDDGVKVLRLGFIGSVLIAALASLAFHTLTDGWYASLLASWAGPDAFERVANIKAMIKRNGT